LRLVSKPILARASLRYLAKHPAQLLLAVLGIAVGVAVVVGIDVASASAKRALRLSASAIAGSTTHVVRAGPAGVPEELFVELALDPRAPPLAPVVASTLSVASDPPRTIEVLGVDPFSEGPFRGASWPASVRAAEPTSAGAWLTETTARELGAAAGGSVSVIAGGERRTLAIAGTFEPSDELARAALDGVAILDIAAAQDLLGSRGRLSRIDVILDDEGIEPLRARLPPGCTLEPASERTETLAGLTRAFELNLSALGMLAMLVGVFLVYDTITFAVVQRRPLWGILRALGATRGELFRLVAGEALAIGAVGTALGIGLGLLLSRSLVGLVTQTINDLYYRVSVRDIALTPSAFAAPVMLGMGATLAGALAPAFDAMRTPPRATLDRALPEARLRARTGRLALAGLATVAAAALMLAASGASLALGLFALFALLLGAALAVPAATSLACRGVAAVVRSARARIAIRGVTSHLSRSSVAIAALATALSASAGMALLVGSFRGTVERWLGYTLAGDAYVSAPGQGSPDSAVLTEALVERIAGSPSVAGFSKYRDLELDLGPSAPGGRRLLATAAELRGPSRAMFRFLEGDPEQVWRSYDAGASLIVSESLARRRSLSVGSTLPILAGDEIVPFEVAGVFRDYTTDQGWAMLPLDTAERRLGVRGATTLVLFAREGVGPEQLVADVRALLAPGEVAVVRTGRALADASLDVFDRTFAVTRVLRILAGVVAVLGLVGALLAILLERETEFGVLRALGLGPRGLGAIVLGQSGLLGLLAGVFALPIGVAVAFVLVEVVNSRAFGWTLDFEVDSDVLLETVALAVLSALLAGVYPAWRISRLSPSQALRGE
jgi:putative ABC transport system permease protein